MSDELKNKLLAKPVPPFSRGEELFNWISHFVGAIFGVAILILFIILNNKYHFSIIEFISLLTYAISVVVLYSCSTIYHFINSDSPYKRIFRMLDHNTIYFLIIGSYFPVVVFGYNNTLTHIIMTIEAALVIGGIIINHFGLYRICWRIFHVILYVAMGWIIVLIPQTYSMIPFKSFMFILSGGILYTLGVIFFVLGTKMKWGHSIFHIFCLLGTFSQFVGVILLAIE